MADARLTALQGLGEVLDREGYSNLVLESLMRKSAISKRLRFWMRYLPKQSGGRIMTAVWQKSLITPHCISKRQDIL